MLERALRALHRAEDLLLASLLLALLLLSVGQIVLRLGFETGVNWAEPLSRSGVFWLAMLGAMGATRARKHIAIDAIPRLLPPTAQRVMWALTHFAAGAVCAALAWYGYALMQLEFEAPVPFIGGISSGWPMLALPLGFGMMALRFAISAVHGPEAATFAESRA